MHYVNRFFSTPSNPKTHLDVLRILGIYMILFTHTGYSGFWYYEVCTAPVLQVLALAMAAIVKMAVPLFLMVSGALLLGKEESYESLFKHRILRYLVILIAISLFWYLREHRDGSYSVAGFFEALYSDQVRFHLWYMYLYISMLFTLPLLRKIAVRMTLSDMAWLILLYEIMKAIPILEYFFPLQHNWNFSLFVDVLYVIYPLCGYFLENKLEEQNYNRMVAGYAVFASLLCIMFTCVLGNRFHAIDGQWMNTDFYFDAFLVIPTLTTFYLCRMAVRKRTLSDGTRKLLSILSGCTFGIYLFEGVVRDAVYDFFLAAIPVTGEYAASYLWALYAMLWGFAVMLVYKLFIGMMRELFSAE